MSEPSRLNLSAPDQGANRINWSNSTKGERVRFMLHDIFEGDRERFARICGLPRKLVADIDRRKIEPSDRHMQQIATRAHEYQGHWVRHGLGRPKGPEGLQVVPMPEPEPKAAAGGASASVTPFAERICWPLDHRWLGDTAAMASACGLKTRRIEDLANGREVPTDDELLAIAAAADVNLEWLVSGEGNPEPPSKPPVMVGFDGAAPAPSPPPPAAPQPSSLDGLIELIDRVRRFEADLASVRADVNASVDGVTDSVTDAIKQIDAMGSKALEMPGRFAEAVKAQIAPFQTSVDHLTSRLNGQQQRLDGIQRSLAAIRLEPIQAEINRLEQAGRVLATNESRIETRLIALESRSAPVNPVDLSRDLARIIARLDALESRGTAQTPSVRQIAGVAQQPTDPGIPDDIRHEANLPAGAVISVLAWSSLLGPHQRLIRDENDRRTAGLRLSKAYRAAGLPHHGNPVRYRVADMRMYVEWLSRAGLNPNPDAWVEHWLRHRSKEGQS